MKSPSSTSTWRRVLALLLVIMTATSVTGCNWDETTQKYLTQAKELVNDYPKHAIAICNQIPDAAKRATCIAQVQADHAQMTKLVLVATLAATDCNEKVFKESIEAIRDLAKAAAKLGLNAIVPIAKNAKVQINSFAASEDGLHYALQGESYAWVQGEDFGPEGAFVGLQGDFSVAFQASEAGVAGVLTGGDFLVQVGELQLVASVNSDGITRPSVVLLQPGAPSGEGGGFSGTMHLMLDIDAPIWGAMTVALRLPVQTADPSQGLQIGLGGEAVPAAQLFPSWSDLGKSTADCNEDGAPDWAQIAAGVAEDCNFDWIIDSCQPQATLVCVPGPDTEADECTVYDCPEHSCGPSRGDLTGDGNVNVSDVQCGVTAALAALTGGAVPSCLALTSVAADMSCDGVLDVIDVLQIISYVLGLPLPDAVDANADGCPNACEPLTCNDHNACTADSYDAAQGCLHELVSCNDGDTTTADSCVPAIGCVNSPTEPVGTAGESCLEVLTGAGCDAGACDACVCDADPFCCETQWDQLCAQRAQGQCLESCAGATEATGNPKGGALVQKVLTAVSNGILPVPLPNNALVGGWTMPLSNGALATRAELQAQAQPIVELGDAAIDALLPWLFAESRPAQYVAIHAIEEIIGGPTYLAPFDESGANDIEYVYSILADGGVPAPVVPIGAFQCCVAKGDMWTTWSPTSGLYPTQMLELQVSVTFGDQGTCRPACCAYDQWVSTTVTFTPAGGVPTTISTAPLHDDNYSRADDSDGNPALTHNGFTTDDNPGMRTIQPNSAVDYSFTARQRITDVCNGGALVRTIGPHTGTVTGVWPKALNYGNVNISWIE